MDIRTQAASLGASYAAQHPEVRPGEYVLIEVSDTGTGIPAEVLNRLFEPFFTTKEIGRGSGLGLSMVFGFMKQSGGYVAVYTEPGWRQHVPAVPAPRLQWCGGADRSRRAGSDHRRP